MAETSGIRSLFTKDMTILLVCIGIAMVFWLAVTLSKSYEGELVLQVNYKNLATDDVFATPPTQSIRVRIMTTGWKLIAHYTDANVQTVSIDMAQYKQASSISTDLLHEQVSRALSSGTKVLNIDPSIISFKHGEKKVKRVPVLLNMNAITFARGYALNGDIILVPDSITVTGPAWIVDSIGHWPTELIAWKDMNETKAATVKLLSTRSTTLELSNEEVSVKLPVEQFTEGNVEVRVTSTNVPEGLSVALIPRKVNVTYKVSLSQYNLVTPDLFVVVASFKDVDLGSSKKIILDLVQSAAFTRNVTLSPIAVEYIVYK